MLGYAHNSKIFSNCQATYQKELYLLFENPAIFLQSERTDRLDHLSTVLSGAPSLHNKRTL